MKTSSCEITLCWLVVLVAMVTARPIAGSLSMEMVGVEVRGADQEQPLSPQMKRQQTLRAVQTRGGHAAGERLSGRERCRRLINSLSWQSGQLIACLADVSMLLADVAGAHLSVVNTVTFFVLLLFCFDLALRAYTFRRMLFRSAWAYFDFTIVGLSVILFVVGVVEEANAHVTSTRGVSASLRSLIVVLRWLRAARAMAMLIKTSSASTSAARQVTGDNKKRYVDLEAGFDLDLCYVRPRLIAMSVPATGCTALYRNPLTEVVRFLESRHAHEGYLVVNLCPELPCTRARTHRPPADAHSK